MLRGGVGRQRQADLGGEYWLASLAQLVRSRAMRKHISKSRVSGYCEAMPKVDFWPIHAHVDTYAPAHTYTPWWSFKWIPGKCKQKGEETQEKAISNLPVHFHSEFLSTSSVCCSCSLHQSWDVSTVIYPENDSVWLIMALSYLGGCSAAFTLHIVRTTRAEAKIGG